MTRESAMQIPEIAGDISMIAGTVADIPIKLYKKEGDRTVEVKEDRRVYMLNQETGDTLDANQMKQAVVRDYFLGGSGYIYVDWDGLEVRSLRYVHDGYVAIAQNSDVIFKDYVILVQGRSFYPDQFIRVLRNSKDGMRGSGIVDQSDKILSVAYHSLLYEEGLVKTGGNKKGFIKSKRKLTQPAMNALKKAWRNLYQNNTENVVILNDGLEFQEASNTSVEMQLNENKKTNAEEIRTILGIPNDLASEDGDKTYIKYCVNLFMGAFIVAINRALLLESEKGTYFFAPDMYELTKGDTDKRYAAYKTAAETGWLQIDEIRQKENMEPLGIDMVKLGLQDVLYDPKTREVYIPNMNQSFKLGENEKSADEIIKEIRATRKRNLIIAGAPGSGKSNYAEQIRQDGDVLIDFDALRVALTGKSHEDIEDHRLISNMRRTAYKYINSSGSNSRFLILSTESSDKKLKSMGDYLNADIYVMPTTKEQAKQYVKNDSTRKDKELFYRLIDEWYKNRKEE